LYVFKDFKELSVYKITFDKLDNR